MHNTTQETIKLITESYNNPSSQRLQKGEWRTDSPSALPTVGPKFYNLDPVVQQLYPVVTPLLKMIRRTKAGGGNAYNFKQITAVNSTNTFSGGVEGQRGALVQHTFKDKTVVFKTSILEDKVTWQSELSSEGLTPQNRALAAITLLNSFFIDEHKNMIGANGSLALGSTPTPVGVAVADATSSLAAGNYVAICVALSYEGKGRSSVATGVQQNYVVTNTMGQTVTVNGGFAKKSAATANIAVVAGEALDLSVADVAGAFGYAWFVGATAATAKIVAVTSGNTVRVKALNTDPAGQLATAVADADNSTNSLRWNGLLTQMSESGSGSIIKSLDGLTLTPNGSGGVIEIDELLQDAYDLHKISYDRVLVPPSLRAKINAAIMGSPAGSGAARLIMRGDNANATTGTFVAEYINAVTGKALTVETIPDLPQNCIVLWSDSVDYQVPDSQNLIEFMASSDYYQIEYPMINLSYDIGVATYGALALRFPPAFGLIKNVG